ncbi:DUF1330 domain-containing protein [Frankia sp. CNm7]|uniref:DUF1330 domain-containing protein n=1 Tax=Frankia nepalensis TaxID=1836974 RepID=A0A937RIN2_9ACTN|nr:DUF1330 domain-containing protein [Frankia nepalensis]MBL7494947.1 DUF1330 domain-containing protein [Frankia nepalensis]MBL7516369.1 DUF1330 domain-containing protein [Frankia nepalensis]MBL7520200.1 DUF1330 domain-containing protein [Frankia nepalensis]MBL7632958.1 DUF1330 domain-containing protein [Frankia nepalensis]
MPKAYVVFTESIKDPAGMAEYAKVAMESIGGSGARPLAVDASPETLEGEWHGNQTVILEFDSVEAAKAWYTSEAYSKAIPLRQAAADCNAAIITGF